MAVNPEKVPLQKDKEFYSLEKYMLFAPLFAISYTLQWVFHPRMSMELLKKEGIRGRLTRYLEWLGEPK